MTFFITLLLVSLSANAAPQKTSRTDGSPIEYELTIPSQIEHWPLLVVLQGSGCELVRSTSFSPYVSTLLSFGFGVLTVEKPGIYDENIASNCPDEYLNRNTIPQRVEDLQTVIAEIRKNTDFQKHWNGSLLWIGSSEGGTVASIAAPLFTETTATALLASGGGMTMAEELKILTEKDLRAQGKTETEITQTLAEMDLQLKEIRANPVANKFWLGETNSYKWWASILDLDIKAVLNNLKSKVYISQGTADHSVPVESADLLVADKKPAPFGQWTYVRYDGLNHQFQDSSGTSKKDMVISNALLWLMVREDQRLRFRDSDIYKVNPKDSRLPDLFQETANRDHLNLEFLKQLFTHNQFPLISSHGIAANRHAWILVQHADSDPTFQREVLTFLEKVYIENKDTFAADLAYLKDRVAVNEAQKEGKEPLQFFGTQGKPITSGCWEPWPIQNYQQVDERRKEYGMGTLAEYTRMMNEVIGKPECNRILE